MPAPDAPPRRPWQQRWQYRAASDAAKTWMNKVDAASTSAEHQQVLQDMTKEAWQAGVDKASGAAEAIASAAETAGLSTVEGDAIAPQLQALLASTSDAVMPDGVVQALAQADKQYEYASNAAQQACFGAAGVQQWDSVADASACQTCLDKEAGSPYGMNEDTPPWHAGCHCDMKPDTSSIDPDNTTMSGMGDVGADPDIADAADEADEGAEAVDDNGLTGSQLQSVVDYQTENWSDITTGLRDGELTGDDPEVANLDAAIAAQEPIDSSLQVLRGFSFPETEDTALEDLQNFIGIGGAGSTFMDDAFVSTTTSEDIAKAFSNQAIMHIGIPPGNRVLDMNKINPGSEYAGEHEVLLPRGATFKVLGIDSSDPDHLVIWVRYLGAAK